MDKSRRIKLSQLLNTIETQNMKDIGARTGNVYESLAIIAKRANQIHADLKQELHAKLEDFASHSDSLEEIHENREQIEISRFYERLPHPTIISTNEFLESGLEARYND
ncbi:MAG: DNA-directed RNA polymerase subunit omega [Chitinophagales bacterium]|jgi:DNA-directed RNA polymerase subunit K/omega|nr:DNA-directed RNA polymerase subunit omega [Chitinophagales bacterium]